MICFGRRALHASQYHRRIITNIYEKESWLGCIFGRLGHMHLWWSWRGTLALFRYVGIGSLFRGILWQEKSIDPEILYSMNLFAYL